MDIIRPTDQIPVSNINLLIFGVPGIGKTSLGCSAKNALLLDFDLGAHRSEFRTDTLQIHRWQEAASLPGEDLSAYDTIVMDTGGRALDMLTRHIMDGNPKHRKADGSLTLQGWGALKASFIPWLAQLRLMGKDIVILAHEREKEKGEVTEHRPDIQGGSYAEIFKLADSAAWYGPAAAGDDHWGVLEFDPSPEHPGKNPGKIPRSYVPDLTKHPHALAHIIGKVKDQLGAIGERGRIVAAEAEEWKNEVLPTKTMKAVNEFAEKAQSIEDRAVQLQVKHIINDHAKSLGLAYDKGKKAFVKVKPEDDPIEQENADASA